MVTREIQDELLSGGAASELFITAAVREVCQPMEMLERWLKRHADADQDALLEAITAAQDITWLGEEAQRADDTQAVILPLETRQEILRFVGAHRAMGRLAQEKPEDLTLTETTFLSLLNGATPSLASQTRKGLVALANAAEWAASVNVSANFDRQTIESELARRDFIEAVGLDRLDSFVGRERQLNNLHQLYRLEPHQREVVIVEGLGGMGKSLLLARFAESLLEEARGDKKPDAFFIHDFERLDLQRGTSSVILSDMVRQAARWWKPQQSESLLVRWREMRVGSLESAEQSSRSQALNIDQMASMLVKTLGAKGQTPRLVVFADTFEEVDQFDDTAALSVREACAALRECGADVMEIYAGRSFARANKLALRDKPVHLSLSNMNAKESISYLRTEAKRKNIELTRSAADAAFRKLKGSPLELVLAVSLMGPSGYFKPKRWLDLLESSEERRKATLYDRVLKRIRDREVRRLAKPGLLLRRLTAAVILDVLAEPCGLDIDEIGACELLDKARRLGQLFVADPAEPGAVWHRRDLRSQIFHDLQDEIESSVAKVIHQRAVDFYVSREGVKARGEEIYHRLQLGQLELANNRWQSEVGPSLKSAIGELPPESADWLRRKLGASSLVEKTQEYRPVSKDYARLEELRHLARRRLFSGEDDLGEIFDEANVPQEVDTVLGDVFAELLVRRGEADLAVSEAAALRSSSKPVPRYVRAGVYACAAGVLEGQRRWEEAFDFWNAASRSGRDREKIDRLSYCIGAMRSSRHARRRRGRPQRRWFAWKLAHEIGSTALADYHVTARETSAELGEILYADRAHQSYQYLILVELIADLIRANEIFVHANVDDKRRQEIVARLSLGRDMSQSDLNAIIGKLVYDLDRDRARNLVDVMREEVDWSFSNSLKHH